MNSQQKSFIEIFNSIDFDQIKDHPNILIAANFWEEERYCAARTCYKFMRAIDDHIDDHKAKNKMIHENEKKKFVSNVNNWIKMIVDPNDSNQLQKELLETINRFRIPLWSLNAFAKSMIYDINNNGFASLQTFLDYAEGASVGPASIFVHLNGLKKENGQYTIPAFDVREVATPCAIFSYLVHIIRDFQKDQFNNLNYFADDLIEKHGLSRSELRNIAYEGDVNKKFRDLVKEYYDLADIYRQKTYVVISKIRPSLEPRYQLSLEIIFNLYLMVFERIDVLNGKFTTGELNPTPEETRKRVYETIMDFKVAPPLKRGRLSGLYK
jgi:phytoene/squalene synthetase